MKYFVDFEATQFCQRIISIGCASESGKTFYTLVKLAGQDKLSSMIIEMTGITKEKLQEQGVTLDEAFLNLSNFVKETSNGEDFEFYCYGNCDKRFISNSKKYMKDFSAKTFATVIEYTLIDYSNKVQKFFSMQNPFSLKKMYTFLKEEEITQNHNALEDAEMLALVVNNFDKCVPEDKEKITAIPQEKKQKTKAPEKFINWPPKKMDADTGADETNWQVKAVISGGPHEKYFDSMETAVLWTIRYVAQGISVKNPDQRAKVEKKIKESITTNKNYCNCVFYERRSD